MSYRGAILLLLSLVMMAIFGFEFAFAHEVKGSVIVHISNTGYEPNEVTILQGHTVIFENTEGLHWPASNIHPTHTVYPGSDIAKCNADDVGEIFDACGALDPGESYEFRFDNVGRWRFHDHENPRLTGTIIVEANPDFVAQEEEASKKPFFTRIKDFVSSFFSDLKNKIVGVYYKLSPSQLQRSAQELDVFEVADDNQKLRGWLELLGPEIVMARLLEQSDGGNSIDCHGEAHQVGRISYEIYGGEVFERGDASCHSGYYHGAMEAFLAEQGTNDLAPRIEELCSIFETSFGKFECLHGVGHGVMAYEDYDLPQAIRTCQSLETSFDQSSCYGGVFMENVVAGQGAGALSGHETEWVSEDSHFPCNAVGENYSVRFQCYQMQTSWMLTLNNYNFKEVTNECLSADPDMVTVCFKSLGRDAAGHTLRDPNKILEICNLVPEDYYGQCINGAVNVIVDFWGAALEGQATELCRLAPERGKITCYSTLAARFPDLFKDESRRANLCDTFEENYRSFCNNP